MCRTEPTAAGIVFQQLEHAGHIGYINIDVIGVGSSAYDSLAAMYPGIARAVNVSHRSDYVAMSKGDKPQPLFRMRNLRAEMYWRFREALDPDSGDDLALPAGNELVADLCAARYQVLAGGVIQIEEKKKIKERIGQLAGCGRGGYAGTVRAASGGVVGRSARAGRGHVGVSISVAIRKGNYGNDETGNEGGRLLI